MKEIILSNGQKTQVSDEDWLWLSPYRWSPDGSGYAQSQISGRRQSMHILIAKSMGVDSPDHKDQNKLNNQRNNLRPATRSQNGANRPKPSNNTSGFKGVTWDRKSCKWKAQIRVDDTLIYLGLYMSRETAANIYLKAAKEYFREFANDR